MKITSSKKEGNTFRDEREKEEDLPIQQNLLIYSIFFILEITAANLTSDTKEKEQRHRELLEETVAVGMMFASKAFVQLLANPIVGPLTHK